MNAYCDEYKIKSGKVNPAVKSVKRGEPRLGIYWFLLSVFDSLLGFIERHTQKLDANKVLNIIKASVGTAGFFAFLGVVGAAETGKISVGFGIIIALFIIFIEYTVCRIRIEKKKEE